MVTSSGMLAAAKQAAVDSHREEVMQAQQVRGMSGSATLPTCHGCMSVVLTESHGSQAAQAHKPDPRDHSAGMESDQSSW
jgi:hypothetical protein